MSPTRPLRVLHVISGDLWAGAEVQACLLLRRLREMGDLRVTAVLFNDGTLAQRLREAGLDILILDERALGLWALVRRLHRHLLELSPDVIHTHRYKETVVAALAARRAGPSALVATVHGHPEPFVRLSGLRMRVYQALNRWVLNRYFRCVICVSDDLRRSLQTRLPRTQLVRIHNALDPEDCRADRSREEIRKDLGVPASAPLIGTVGRLAPVKNLDLLLRSTRRVLERVPECRLVIVGDGPEAPRLKSLSQALGLERVVTFTGFRADASQLVAGLDMCAISSHSEGIPMIVLEAMALGVPIVATRVGGLPEMLEDGVSARLVAPGDEQMFAHACTELLLDPALRARLAGAARERLETHFTASTMAHSTASVYRSLAPVTTAP